MSPYHWTNADDLQLHKKPTCEKKIVLNLLDWVVYKKSHERKNAMCAYPESFSQQIDVYLLSGIYNSLFVWIFIAVLTVELGDFVALISTMTKNGPGIFISLITGAALVRNSIWMIFYFIVWWYTYNIKLLYLIVILIIILLEL